MRLRSFVFWGLASALCVGLTSCNPPAGERSASTPPEAEKSNPETAKVKTGSTTPNAGPSADQKAPGDKPESSVLPSGGAAAIKSPVSGADGSSRRGATADVSRPTNDDGSLPPKYKEPVKPEALAHYQKAHDAARTGQTNTANEEFTAALEAQPNFPLAREEYGVFLLNQSQLMTASIVYADGVKLRPNDPDAHNDLGVALIRMGDTPGAKKEFERAIELKPDDPEPHHNLGLLLLSLGKIDAAIEQLNEALHLRPAYLDAHFDLGRALMRRGQLDQAAAQFREALKINREHYGALLNLGRIASKQGKLGDAVKQFTLAIRENPNSLELRMALGEVLVKLGNARQAITHFLAATRLSPEYPEAQLQLALALAEEGRFEEAIAHNEEALSLRPDWPEALNNLAWLLATAPDERLRDPERAVNLANSAKGLADYKAPLVFDTLAASQAEAGQWDQAVKSAEKAIALAKETGQAKTAEEIEGRLKLYRDHKAYRQDKKMTNDE